jgi:hypothetical protein
LFLSLFTRFFISHYLFIFGPFCSSLSLFSVLSSFLFSFFISLPLPLFSIFLSISSFVYHLFLSFFIALIVPSLSSTGHLFFVAITPVTTPFATSSLLTTRGIHVTSINKQVTITQVSHQSPPWMCYIPASYSEDPGLTLGQETGVS